MTSQEAPINLDGRSEMAELREQMVEMMRMMMRMQQERDIQDLIDSKWLEFKDVPTITGNPLPNHGNQGKNVLEQDDDMAIVDRVEGIKTPLKNIFNAMCHLDLVEMVGGSVYEDDVCIMHGATDHTLEECAEFRALI
ncbi:hypothetical protein Lal_00042602 [Lupinus albus]|nr:hypothetical protein Lal_00042602 [Lupinus albus]